MPANQDFYQEFLAALNDHNVEYLIFGGFAVNFYGFSRVTEDLDVWINPSAENLVKFEKTLVDLGFPKEDQAFMKFVSGESIMLRLSDEAFRVDIITKLNIRKSFREAFQNSETIEMPYGKIFFLGYADLIDEKIRAKRPKDLNDINQLRKIRKG